MRIKICGIRSLEGAIACREAGADFVGLNFVPTSRRLVSLEMAKKIVDVLDGLPVVGVFADQDRAEIERIVESLGIAWVQLHGHESPAFCRELSKRFHVIKAIAVGDDFDGGVLAPYREWVDYFLFDAPKAGSGKVFDWEKLLSMKPDFPYLLAGGLNPENVVEAIALLNPDGVDTASGVEIAGKEDPARILDFCRSAGHK